MVFKIIVWILLSLGVGLLGDSRRVGFAGGFFWSLLLSPLIGVIIVLASQRKGDFETELQRLKGAPPPPMRSAQAPGVAAELERLKSLHDSGALTDAEYEAAKGKVLG